MSIFKKVEKKTTDPKEKHVHVKVGGAEFDEKLLQLVELKEEEKLLKTRMESVQGEVVEIGKAQFCELYSKNNVNPNTFILESENAQVMVQPMDKYLKIDGERAKVLTEEFGANFVEEKTEYTFNNELLTKHFEKIEKALGNLDIPAEDKENLITGIQSFSVKKGSIDLFGNVSKEKGMKLQEVLSQFNPIFALKSFMVRK